MQQKAFEEYLIKERFKRLYNYELRSWQVRATDIFLHSQKHMIVKTPRGGRKSTWLDLMATDYILHNKDKFGIIATVGADVASEHIRRIRNFLVQNGYSSMFVEPQTQMEINLNNGSRVLAIPQSAETRVGYHPNIKFVDEMSRINPTFFLETLKPMGRGLVPPSREIIVSTPKQIEKGEKPLFYELWNSPDYEKVSSTLEECDWIPSERIEEERRNLPEKLFKIECLGEFVFLEDNPFDLKNVVIEEDIEYKREENHVYVFGVDLARKHDWTVITILDITEEPAKVVFLYRTQANWKTQITYLEELYKEWQPIKIIIDATGIGDPILEFVSDLPVEPFIFTEKTKTDLITHLQVLTQHRKIMIPSKFAQLIKELEWYEWNDKNQTDDCVMSLGLASWSLRQRKERVSVLKLDHLEMFI